MAKNTNLSQDNRCLMQVLLLTSYVITHKPLTLACTRLGLQGYLLALCFQVYVKHTFLSQLPSFCNFSTEANFLYFSTGTDVRQSSLTSILDKIQNAINKDMLCDHLKERVITELQCGFIKSSQIPYSTITLKLSLIGYDCLIYQTEVLKDKLCFSFF